MNSKEIINSLTLEEKAGLCSGRDFWHTKAIERLDVPSVMMCDGPHGLRKQTGEGDHLGINVSIETNCYPSASALASSFDRELLSELGTVLGQECQAEDVAMLLGPGLNMKRSPLCGRNFEYFSEDPYLAGELGAAYIQSLQEQGISACVKHFAANNQETRRMSGSSNMDERTLYEIYLPAFEAAVKKGGTRSVMCAYNAINGTFCAENKQLLSDILRDKWGYQGFVVTDWGAVKDRVKGLQAGLDLEMPGGGGTQDAGIVEAVQKGILDEAVLDKAVEHMLAFVETYQEGRRLDTVIDRAANTVRSGEFAARCAVLLKNEDAILPLRASARVAFIGEFAAAPRYQGAGSSHINVPHAISAVEAAGERNVVYAQGYDIHSEENADQLLEQAVETAGNADIAVVFAGLPDSFETEGCDRDSLAMPDSQNRLIEAVAAVNPNTVVVLHGGSVMELPWLNRVKAILYMALGGENVGTAAVKLLYGEVNPSGKLAETWPRKLADNPSHLNFPGEDGRVTYAEGIFIGYRYYDKKQMEVLFPFGYGLSYTRFQYSGLKLDKTEMQDTEVLTVTCRVKNIGGIAGAEAVQLYVRDEAASVRRPIRELKGFDKVMLSPGQEKEITFTLDKRAFVYYEEKIHDWFVESGKFFIEIGASSRDIRLSEEVTVNGTLELPVHYTRESTVDDLMKSAQGRGFFEKMMAARRGNAEAAQADNVKNMGEGSEKMVQSMMFEMPLGALVTYGVMNFEQLDGLIAMLNA
ncbi:MAG: glycoside hydrolase family 3 C-terminal domain-containing protein [Lachnospiraceae bacterium]|nr:glycoside hydrolase family 3 C-terminal domain-containing protein [Acetatifactor muris]MCM1218595.1 glycoside hydrolase family 3 C-terminal domain-containing protein [Lachnospiraceae bacterium]